MARQLLGSAPMRAIIGILLLWSISRLVIAAGHGAGPLGDFMISGEAQAWLAPQIFGWLAILAEVVALGLLARQSWPVAAGLGILAGMICMTLFIVKSETARFLWDENDRVGVIAIFVVLRILQVLWIRKKKPNQSLQPTALLGRG